MVDYEKIAKREVLRRLSSDHIFYEDLMQEARIALHLASKTLDEKFSPAMRTSYLKQAVRWRITKAYHGWLRTETNTSVRKLRRGAAIFKVKQEITTRLADAESLSKVAEIEFRKDLNTIVSTLKECVETEDEKLLYKAITEGMDLRDLGQRLSCSHQGAANKKERLIKKARAVLFAQKES